MTPEFQGTHLWDRLGWAKENLEPYRSEYCIVWEDPDNLDEPAKVTHPDPNWMAPGDQSAEAGDPDGLPRWLACAFVGCTQAKRGERHQAGNLEVSLQ